LVGEEGDQDFFAAWWQSDRVWPAQPAFFVYAWQLHVRNPFCGYPTRTRHATPCRLIQISWRQRASRLQHAPFLLHDLFDWFPDQGHVLIVETVKVPDGGDLYQVGHQACLDVMTAFAADLDFAIPVHEWRPQCPFAIDAPMLLAPLVSVIFISVDDCH
jgi:hypothetical protein